MGVEGGGPKITEVPNDDAVETASTGASDRSSTQDVDWSPASATTSIGSVLMAGEDDFDPRLFVDYDPLTSDVAAGAGGAATGLENEPRADDAHGRQPDTRRRFVIGIVALIVLIALIVVVTRGSGDSGSSSTSNAPATRIAEGTGRAVDGATWRAVKGTWTVSSDRFAIGTPGRLGFSMLITNGTADNVVVRAKLPVAASAAGVVFRYQSPLDYWAVEAAPQYSTWRIVKVVGGKTTEVANTKLATVVDGVAVDVVSRADGTVGVSIAGSLRTTISDPALATKTGVGLIAAAPSAQRAVFSSFSVSGIPSAGSSPSSR